MPTETPNLQIAHIRHGDFVFQILNEDGTNWDEAATRADYELWIAENT